jgi:hypothetical protein
MMQELFVNDPQKLIDDETIFQFNEVAGNVKLVNGVAAGGPWFVFEFVSGPYAGKQIACMADDIYELDEVANFTYALNCCDDGMFFNKDPALGDEDDWGGSYVPELDGQVFTVKEN